MVAIPHRPRFKLEGIQSAIRLGDSEASLVGPLYQWRQPAFFLRVRSEHHDRMEPEDIHMDSRRAGQAGACGRNGLHHERGFGDAQPRPAVFLRHRYTEPASVAKRLVKIVRKRAIRVLAMPVVVIEWLAQPLYRVPDVLLFFSKCEIHHLPLLWCAACSTLKLRMIGQAPCLDLDRTAACRHAVGHHPFNLRCRIAGLEQHLYRMLPEMRRRFRRSVQRRVRP
jgi:hypothetical protein